MRATFAIVTLTVGVMAMACGGVETYYDAPPPPPKDAGPDACTMVTWYADCDGDGVAALTSQTMSACEKPAASACGGTWVMTMPITGAADCDDTRADVHPGAAEICDSVDNNCNGAIDEGGLTTFYRDADSDGHGNPAMSMTTCNPPAGYVTSNDDCNDANNAIYPGHAEVCDTLDNNCNNQIDEGVTTTYYRDADADGHGNAGVTTTACSAPSGYVASSDDCNDSNNAIYPGHAEVCDTLDNNCNNQIDEGVQTTYYRDADGDGYGNAGLATLACSAPSGYVANATDCNDGAVSVHPGATELCFNGTDDNCSGTQDEAVECSMDCDWSGTRWLSWGYDMGGAFQVGAWVTCRNGKLNSMTYINTSGGTPPAQPPGGTSTGYIDCNWGAANRWASQGWDGANAFLYGADVHCDGVRVTSMSWGNNLLGNGQTQYPDIVGQLACNWSGAIFLSHGIDGNCAFGAGFIVTCNNSHITNFNWIEGGSCVRQRD